jgi:Putative beta-barrel porin-2, OmpL-like. bbp2
MKKAVRILYGMLFIALFLPLTVRAEEAAPPFDISGSVDTYYGYNFNKPMSNTNGVGTNNFVFYSNAFSLSLAELVIKHDASPVGFRIDLDYGATADWVACGSTSCDPNATPEATYKNIQQAYVTWATPVGLTLDMGKFVTHMGLEVIESQDNWNYTRSLLFCCPIPYYHEGIRANYAINDMIFVNGYVYNGWNNVVENNNMKTFGAQIGITPIEKLPIVLNWIGPESSAGVYTDKQSYDAIVTFNATDMLSFIFNYDYGTQKDDSPANLGTLSYSGWAAYARLHKDDNALALRYEMTDDKDNIMYGGTTSNGNKINEITVTAEHTVSSNLLTRVEYRYDSSDDKVYEDDKGNFNKASQSMVVVGVVYTF